MFCPECKSEYREDITVCSTCQIPLVEELPSDVEPEFVDFEEVLQTYNAADVAFVKSLLESEGITYLFQEDSFNQIPAVVPARLLVRKDQADLAREILQDTQLTFMAVERSEPATEKNESPA